MMKDNNLNLSQKSLSIFTVNSSSSSQPLKKLNVKSKKLPKYPRDGLEAREKYPKVTPEYETCIKACREQIKDFFSDQNNSWLAPFVVLLGWYSVKKIDIDSSEIGDPFATMHLVYGFAHGEENNFDTAELCLQLVRDLFPIISLADFYQLAGVVALQSIGGPEILFHPGREDDDDRQMLLCGRDIVALSAAYDLGIRSASVSASASSGDFTPVFDNSYFKELLNGEKESGEKEDLKPSHKTLLDRALLDDPVFRRYVEKYAKDKETFFEDYAAAHLKLSELGYFDA